MPKGNCNYCGNKNVEVKGTPLLSDVPAKMCRTCWNMTKEEYLASEDAYIGEFDNNNSLCTKPWKKETKDNDEYISKLISISNIWLMNFLADMIVEYADEIEVSIKKQDRNQLVSVIGHYLYD